MRQASPVVFAGGVSGHETFLPTERTTIGRSPERGTADWATADAILDEGLLCHIGLTTDHGPVVIPTAYALADVWAGVIPVQTHFGNPIDDERLGSAVSAPPSVTGYRRPR